MNHKPPTINQLSETLIRSDLSAFIEKCFYTINPGISYKPNWHIELIADRLKAVESGEIKRLIINIPPRYLKSLCVNVAWPCWLMGHNPNKRIISASYSQSISTKHSLDSRLIINSDWYKKIFPKTKLTDDQNQKEKFVTTKRGFRLATSTGGSLTGEGGDFLILDDPQNPVGIMSNTQRDTVTNWYEQVFASRLDDKNNGAIVIIMQRLHEDDLSGYLLKKAPDIWHHVKIPAMAEENINYHFLSNNKQLEFKENKALHEARESKDNLENTKKELGGFNFSAQYLQNPLPFNDGMVKPEWLACYKTPPALENMRIYQSWDCAIKSGKNNDYSAVSTWAESNNNYYLLEVQRFKFEYPELKRAIINHYNKYNPNMVLIEDKASGQSLIQELRKETKIPISAINPKLDKISRFAAITTLIEAGKVQLPQHADWLADFEAELLAFPNAAHDDMVDSISQYLNWVKNKNIIEPRIRRL